VCRGSGRAVVLEGDAGIGKTSLLRQVRSAAGRQNIQVLSGGGEELEQRVPFAAVAHCLGVRDAADPDLAPLTRLLTKNLEEDAPAALGRMEFVITEAVVALLERRCAQGQVALLIDDLQWADAGTLLVVHRLCQAIQQLPLLVVVTRRPVPCGGIRQLADAPWTAPRHRCETGLTPATLNGGCPKVYGSCLPVLPPRSAW